MIQQFKNFILNKDENLEQLLKDKFSNFQSGNIALKIFVNNQYDFIFWADPDTKYKDLLEKIYNNLKNSILYNENGLYKIEMNFFTKELNLESTSLEEESQATTFKMAPALSSDDLDIGTWFYYENYGKCLVVSKNQFFSFKMNKLIDAKITPMSIFKKAEVHLTYK